MLLFCRAEMASMDHEVPRDPLDLTVTRDLKEPRDPQELLECL